MWQAAWRTAARPPEGLRPVAEPRLWQGCFGGSHVIRLLVFIAALLAPWAAFAAPIPIKVVVLTTFEVGKDTGDLPGEFQHWVERYPLSEVKTLPGIDRPVRLSKDGAVMGLVTGMRGRPRESLAALLLNPDYDFSKTYWIVAGIAGVDPRAGSIGSAAWANWVVDADPIYEIDDREIPKDWPWGLYALQTKRPGVKGSMAGSSGMAWRLDPGLTQWAYQTTRNISLADVPHLAEIRARFASEPAAQKPPHVMIGDALGTVRFWHGDLKTQWARDWVKIHTDGQGVFVMTDCEDQGIMDVLTLHGREGRVDVRRVMVLRTGSNYSRPGDGEGGGPVSFTEGGAGAAFEAAYRVGSPVVKALVAGWARYATALPQARP